VYCNHCGNPVQDQASRCANCGADLQPFSAPPRSTPKPSRLKIISAIALAVLSLLLRVSIAAAILIRDYSFFEATVVSLLAIMFCSMALRDADAEADKLKAKETATAKELWASLALASKQFAYAIIALMAFGKLLLALFK
jgi:hypothetical protein